MNICLYCLVGFFFVSVIVYFMIKIFDDEVEKIDTLVGFWYFVRCCFFLLVSFKYLVRVLCIP